MRSVLRLLLRDEHGPFWGFKHISISKREGIPSQSEHRFLLSLELARNPVVEDEERVLQTCDEVLLLTFKGKLKLKNSRTEQNLEIGLRNDESRWYSSANYTFSSINIQIRT